MAECKLTTVERLEGDNQCTVLIHFLIVSCLQMLGVLLVVMVSMVQGDFWSGACCWFGPNEECAQKTNMKVEEYIIQYHDDNHDVFGKSQQRVSMRKDLVNVKSNLRVAEDKILLSMQMASFGSTWKLVYPYGEDKPAVFTSVQHPKWCMQVDRPKRTYGVRRSETMVAGRYNSLDDCARFVFYKVPRRGTGATPNPSSNSWDYGWRWSKYEEKATGGFLYQERGVIRIGDELKHWKMLSNVVTLPESNERPVTMTLEEAKRRQEAENLKIE